MNTLEILRHQSVHMFVVVVTLVLAGINFYLYLGSRAAFPAVSVFFATVLGLLFLSLFAAIWLEKRGKLRLAIPFSWVGYTWLGVSGIALSVSLVGDLAQFVAPGLDDRIQFLATVGITTLLSIIAAASARRFNIKHVPLRNRYIGPPKRSLTIVQLSDLHLSESSSLARTRRIADAINKLKPDIVVSTGDLFEGYFSIMAPFVDCLRQIEAPLGKFAVDGNHEVYAGLDEALSLTQLAGFSVLRNESARPTKGLLLCGVEDPASPMNPDEEAALRMANDQAYTILLKHRPKLDPESVGKFDLQLSGHTHGGQIAPFHLVTKLAFKTKPGLNEVAPGQLLYLSRGTGSWGPQMRLLAPSEITVFTLPVA